jgi:hypothetical protein
VHRTLMRAQHVEQPVTISEGLTSEIVCARQF